MSQLWKNEDGQAIVEYVLMLIVLLSLVSAMAIGFRKIALRIWEDITQKVTSGSPLSPPNSQYRLRR